MTRRVNLVIDKNDGDDPVGPDAKRVVYLVAHTAFGGWTAGTRLTESELQGIDIDRALAVGALSVAE